MYVRENDKPVENFTAKREVKEVKEEFEVGPKKFPLWLLFVIIGAVLAVGLFLMFGLRKGKATQKYGFRFY